MKQLFCYLREDWSDTSDRSDWSRKSSTSTRSVGILPQSAQAVPYGLRPLGVHVAEVTLQPMENTHNYLGTVEAWQVARVSSRIASRVDTVLVREGDSVQTGDLLLQPSISATTFGRIAI